MVYFSTERLNKTLHLLIPKILEKHNINSTNYFIVHSYQTLLPIQIHIGVHGSDKSQEEASGCVTAERRPCFASERVRPHTGSSQSPKGLCIRFQSITAWKICSNDSPGQGCVHCAACLHGFVEIIVSEGRRKGLRTEWGLCQAKLLIVLNEFQRSKQQVMAK